MDILDSGTFEILVVCLSLVNTYSGINLQSQCPNTYSLTSFLKKVSSCVAQAFIFYQSLNFVKGRWYPFSVKNNVVTFGLVSVELGQVVDVEIDFNKGFSSAPDTFKIIKTIGSVNEDAIKKIAAGVQPGPEYIKLLANKLELYFRDKERKKERLSRLPKNQ